MKEQAAGTFRKTLAGFFNPVMQVIRSFTAINYHFLLFLVIPVVFILAVTIGHYSRGPFYLWSIDPEYFYMYNSVILGAGNLSLQYFAHPGTPLHFIIALSARILDLFQRGDYMQNFVNDPEKYIHAANLFMNILITIVIFISGKYTLKYTGSILAALVIQLSPFASFSLLSMSGRLVPEALMIVPLMLLILMILKTIHDEEQSRNPGQNLVLFGMIIGFGISCKLTFFPVIVFPLIFLKTGWKDKIRSVLYTLFFFVIFAYPLIFNISDAWTWISGIFTHTGKYATGEAGFIDLSTLPGNISYMFSFNRGFFLIMIFSLVISLLSLFNLIKKDDFPAKMISRAIISLFITVFLCAVIILKHFELYYFMPFTLFTLLFVLLAIMLILRLKSVSDRNLLKGVVISGAIVLVSYILVQEVSKFRTFLADSFEKNKVRSEVSGKILSLVEPQKPLIVTGPYYGTPFIEFAHVNGFIMSDNHKGFYTGYLKEKFPDFYKYSDWTEKFYSWDDLKSIDEIISDTTSFYIYVGQGMSSDFAEIEKRIAKSSHSGSFKQQVRFHDPSTGEKLIEIYINDEQ